MKAINYQVISVAGYVMNVCNLGKGNLNELDLIGKSVIRRERFHERQSGDEREISFKEKLRWQRIGKFQRGL